MNTVFVAALIRNELDVLSDVPRGLLDPAEVVVLDWIWDYRKKYNQLPTIDRMDKEFPFFMSSAFLPADPTRDIFDQFIQKRQQSKLSTALAEMTENVRDGRILYPAALTSLLQYTVKVESGMVSLADFDLDWFVREGPALSLGIDLFDQASNGGMRASDYTLIVGRPGVGKSLIGSWLAYKWWEQDSRILVVSKEMKFADMLGRIFAMVGQFNPKLLRNPASLPLDVQARIKVAQHLVRTKLRGSIQMPKKPVRTPDDLMAILDTHQYDVVIIDGLYLLTASGGAKQGAKWEKMSDISNQLKAIANETNVPILGITQLKRGTDKKGLDLEDIAYSDSLGQDADFVIALADDENQENTIEARLTKNRHGEHQQGSVQLGAFLSVDWNTMQIKEGLLGGTP